MQTIHAGSVKGFRNKMKPSLPLDVLSDAFGQRLQTAVPLSRYTAARVGGRADAFVVVESADELAETTARLWELDLPFFILGAGSNILVSDAGVRSVVILNRARQIRFDEQAEAPTVWAESGANFGVMARQAALRGLSGLEWAAGIPGTLGGAVVGNAGAYDGDLARSLMVAEILHPKNGMHKKNQVLILREQFTVEKMAYTYRSSILKRPAASSKKGQPQGVVLSAVLKLGRSSVEAVQAKIDSFTEQRRRTQPPGASMGSMFKNPPGDYAGRLIEECGLKGLTQGGAEISRLHANFFINTGSATASDVFALIEKAREAVKQKFGVELQLEVELIGEW